MPLSQAEARKKILDLVNAFRKENSVPALTADAKLDVAAQWQSQNMADNGYMGHTDSQGRGVSARVKAECGYAGGCGENVAVGFADPKAVMEGWKESPGHRKNMLNPDYKTLGVGYVYKSFEEEKQDADSFDFMDYWTQVFGCGS